MEKYDVIIVGGGVAGLSAAVTLVKKHKNKKVLMIREEEKELVPCGIPYVFGKLGYDVSKEVKPHQAFLTNGGEFLADTVISIDREKKEIKTSSKSFAYDKLILATGSSPLVPKFIKGYDNKNVYYIKKSHDYIKKLAPIVKKANKIAVIGGGFIGLETADEIAEDKSKEVSVVEMQENCLSQAFSKSFCEKAEKALEKKNIKILNNTKLSTLEDAGDQTKLIFSDDTTLVVDLVIFALGYTPNTELAKEIGLELDRFKAIKTDSFMHTTDYNISAIGDCAQKVDFITGKNINAMLASVAGAESRLLVENIFGIKTRRNCLGTIRIFSTSLNNEVFASVGITKEEADRENVKVFTSEFMGADKHPETLPNTSKVTVKLTIMQDAFHIIGAEIHGGVSVGEMINVVGTAIQAKLNIYDFYTFQIASQPLLTGGPTVYPIIKALEGAIRKIEE